MTGSIYSWSTTAASNANSDGDINFAEGQPPSTLNNSNRQVMGRDAELLADTNGSLTAGGTANALTVTANSAFVALQTGIKLALKITADNTAAATLNANGLGAKAIRKFVAAGETALVGGEMQQDCVAHFVYSAALNSAAGGWLLLNPVIDVPNLVTLTGSQTLTNKSLSSPALTGTPTTPTAAPGTNTTQVASTAFAAAAIAALSSVYQAASAVLTALAGIGTAVSGDLIYATGAGTWGRRAKGSDGQLLQLSSGLPVWATVTLSKSFESTQQTITTAGALTLAHSLGVSPKLVQVSMVCQTAERNYSIGDEVVMNPSVSDPGSGGHGFAVSVDTTNVTVRFSSGTPITGFDKSSGVWGNFTNANWKLVVRAWA